MVKWILIMLIQHSICFNNWGKPWKEPQSVWSASGFELGTLHYTSSVWWIWSVVCSVHSKTLSQTVTVGGSWNKSLHLQPLQRCYCENSGSTTSAFVMQRHYSIKYMQSLHAINGLAVVGRMGNLLWTPLIQGLINKDWDCVCPVAALIAICLYHEYLKRAGFHV